MADPGNRQTEPIPLKKTRCSRCWARLGRARAELAPLCVDCREGNLMLFGPREDLLPPGARPITDPA